MMRFQPTLRQLLTVPYVVLVLLAALLIGVLSYNAGREAVNTLSNLVLNETVGRIVQAIDRHISGSEAVLETAFPADVPPPDSVEDNIDQLRERLWLATTIHRDPNNYAYYGNQQGQFIGLFRHSAVDAELRLRTDDQPRSIYNFSRIRGDLGEPNVESVMFDPRERPWFKAGQSTDDQTWTEVYIDFKTNELVATRARRVQKADGLFEGVVATDMSLHHLDEFLDSLTLSPNGVAFIVEDDGDLLATSRGPHLRKGVGEEDRRLNAAESDDPLVVATYEAVWRFIDDRDSASGAGSFDGPDGDKIQAGFARLQDSAGLNWVVAVATPRSDFMGAVTRNVQRTAIMSLIACTLIVLLGLYILNRIARNLRQFSQAARRMGEGDMSASVPVDRNDEIGELAKAFDNLQKRLLTDRLTGIANREAMIRRLEDRLVHIRRSRDEKPFALLFIDLDNFKRINDQFGHEAGDRVLKEAAERIVNTVRQRDMAARFGGDEFVVFLTDVESRNVAVAVANKLKLALRGPYDAIAELSVDKEQPFCSASIGLAMFPQDGEDIETLLKKADSRMYRQKGTRSLEYS